MSDLYTEQLVKRRTTGADIVKKAGLIVLTIFSAALMLFIPFLIIAPILMVALDVFLFKRMDVEFEYLYVNGELDIDKIMGKAKRKKQLSIDMNSLEIVAPKGSHELDSYRNRQMKVMDFTSMEPEARVYEMIINQNNQQLRIFFEPNQTIIDGMGMTAPRKVFR